MADRLVQLTDKDNNNIYPVTINQDDIARITMTTTDPGEGSALPANHFIGVYGQSGTIGTEDIADSAVTSSKIDFATIDWASGATIGNYNGTPVKIKTVSGNISSTINNWKNIGSIGSGHTILGAFGAFMEGTTGYPFPGTSASENNVIYIDSSGSVFVKSDYSFALGKPCKVTVIYV